MLIALAGLPASGKSSLARRLAAELPATLLDKDSLRDFLFGAHVDYRAEQNDLVMDIAYRVSAYLHAQQPDIRILIDGRTFSENVQITTLKQQARQMNTALYLIECTCSAASARARLARDAATHPARDRNFDLYLRRRASAEPITEPKLELDTDRLSLDDCVARAIAWLQAKQGRGTTAQLRDGCMPASATTGLRQTQPLPPAAHSVSAPGANTVGSAIVVVDIGGTKTRMGRVSEGQPRDDFQDIDSQRFNTADPARVLADIVTEYSRERAFVPDAVVVGIPGVLDQTLDTISHCNNVPSLEGTGLRFKLESLLGCRVLFEQDIMLQVLGEWRAGVAQGHESVIGVYFGTGIGSTWLRHGDPRVSPAVCLQAGHIPAGFDGLLCGCGNTDCVEAYACGHTLQLLARTHGVPVSEIFLAVGTSPDAQADSPADRPADYLADYPADRPPGAASAGAPGETLEQALKRFVQHQAALLATLVTLSEPDMIVIGGGIPMMHGYPRDALIALARDHLQKPWPANRDCFGFARLGSRAPLYGALALAS